jgi:hypothetical protein
LEIILRGAGAHPLSAATLELTEIQNSRASRQAFIPAHPPQATAFQLQDAV